MREATSERQANDRPRRRASDNRLVFETLEALYVAHAACLVLELEDLFASMHVDHVLESELPAGDRLGVGRARVEVDEARVVEDEAALFARVVAAPEAIHVDAHVDAGLCLVVEQSLVDLGEDQAGGGSDADDSDSALPHRVHVHLSRSVHTRASASRTQHKLYDAHATRWAYAAQWAHFCRYGCIGWEAPPARPNTWPPCMRIASQE
mmetsp:Transcript_3074/g.6471  ORF Transcript_3074/g.6471 Transcript_3074/m.6471 type:complete len:208 (+) Transcript_3074:180-803(+)